MVEEDVITFEQACDIADQHMARDNTDAYSIERDRHEGRAYGWIFFRAARDQKTGEKATLPPGSGPFLVNKHDSTVHELGSHPDWQAVLQAYELQKGYRKPWWKFW